MGVCGVISSPCQSEAAAAKDDDDQKCGLVGCWGVAPGHLACLDQSRRDCKQQLRCTKSIHLCLRCMRKCLTWKIEYKTHASYGTVSPPKGLHRLVTTYICTYIHIYIHTYICACICISIYVYTGHGSFAHGRLGGPSPGFPASSREGSWQQDYELHYTTICLRPPKKKHCDPFTTFIRKNTLQFMWGSEANSSAGHMTHDSNKQGT